MNKCAGLFRDLVSGKNKFMCFFSRHSLWGEKAHKQNPPQKSRDNPVKIMLYVQEALKGDILKGDI